jgi:hypothetical protein
MKTKIVLMITIGLIVFLSSITFAADNKDFYESGQIVDGEVWNMVNIYNDGTVVDMSGGMCDFVGTHDRSTFNMTDGHADGRADDYSTANISGGTFTGFHSWGHGTINLDGMASGHYLTAYSFGILNINGGIVDYATGYDESTINFFGQLENIVVCDSSIANLHKGSISDYIGACDSSIINVFGYDLHKTFTGGAYNHGQITGFWDDDSAFTVDIYDMETHSHIVLIPEPLSFFLFGAGSLFLSRKKRN